MASLNIVTAWPMPTPPAHWSAPGQPVFVGRRRERSVLDRAWAETQRGIRQFVLVCGEAGAGKSRLVTETANAVHRLGAAVLVGGCALDFGRPYDPVAEPVRSLLPWTTHGGIQLGDEVATQAEVIDRLRLVAGGVGGSSVNSPRLLFDAVSRLMIEAVGPHPLVLVLEDLQWAAETGVQLSGFILNIRLDQAHAWLSTNREARSQQQIAQALGYNSPAAFSRAYRRKFGEAMSETRRRAVNAINQN